MTSETLTMLWLGAGAVTLWMWLPAVLNALGLTLLRVSVDDDAAALEPSGDDAEYAELFTRLRSLGFVPVGRSNKTGWFFCHHWCRKFQSHVFAVPRGDCIAVTYKLWPWDRWRLYFLTAFSDGAIVETANQVERLRIDEPDHFRWGLATPDRALLLERHRDVCRSFAASGSGGGAETPVEQIVDRAGAVSALRPARKVAVLPVEEVIRLELHHSSRYHRRHQRCVGLIVMSLSLFCLGIGWLCLGAGLMLVGRFEDAAPYLLPISVIAWGFLWPAVLACLLRAGASRGQAEDESHPHDQPTPRRLDGEAL
jgi:hypothetical protein